jgi:predicted HTH domain antitoxin
MSLVLEIPDAVEQALRLPDAERERQLLQELALALYARGILPSGKARQLAGLSRVEFGLLLGRRGIPRQVSEEDVADDLRYASGE